MRAREGVEWGCPMNEIPLNVLELASVSEGYSSGDALSQASEMAQVAEECGYSRFWVAEHHGMVAVASSAPAVLLAHIARSTSTIRLGAGGVMLPNHAPMVIAEQFGMLEALHPGRIDLGLGRAPGSDFATARALRRTAALSANNFPDDVVELIGYFRGAKTQPYANPALGNPPQVWILGSSLFGAQLAGLLGLPFAFAYHFAPAQASEAFGEYRKHFRATQLGEQPHAMAVVTTLAADEDERAEYLAGPAKLSMMLLRTNRFGPLPTPHSAASYPYTDGERALAEEISSTYVIGGPERVVDGLRGIVDRFGLDELMITTRFHDPADRRRCLGVVAEAWGTGASAAVSTGANRTSR